MADIKILVADDHAIVRDGLRQILGDAPGLTVSAEAATGDEVLAQLRHGTPDVVLLDMSMPGRSGIDLIKAVKNAAPQLPLLVLSMHGEDQYAIRAIKAGASGYITKAGPSAQLLTAVRRVAEGHMYISSAVAEKLARSLSRRDPAPRHERLSDRELDVFLRLARGQSVTDIAGTLCLSTKTISTHKARVMQKLAVQNLSELIRYGLDHGLLQDVAEPA